MSLSSNSSLFSLFFVVLAIMAPLECTDIVTRDSLTQKSCYCLEEIVSGLYNPVMASFVNQNGNQESPVILVAEQRGVVLMVDWSGRVQTMLDIRQRVVSSNDYGDERGLLSAVPSPDFAKSGKIYLAYTRLDEGEEYTYVSQFRASGDKINPKSERFLLRVYQPFRRGNGGPMFFGDDGYLYIVTGDGGAHDDRLGHAQNKNSFHGSVLRIDVNGGQDFTSGHSGMAKAYRVPDDNPFAHDVNATDEIYAYGFRNMWGCSQDSTTRGGDGRIYCAETGTSIADEINVIEKGKNYGWNLKEGTSCYNSRSCQSIENEALPIYEFPHSGQHALVGGYVYRGREFPWLHGKTNYIFGDVITGKVKILKENPVSQVWTAGNFQACNKSDCPSDARKAPLKHILAFAQDGDGELYLLMVDALTAHSPKGKMFKLMPARSATIGLTFGSLSIILTLLTAFWVSGG